ncbi:hypothetical protein B566_EDAN002310 [Ephemera danica]|nr:hypothetical protein B566_EDAN002310 [Ephemera danica]
MDEQVFPDGLNWISEDSFCVCNNVLCCNVWSGKIVVSSTHSSFEEEKKMHTALQTQDCHLMCHLLDSGVALCTNGAENCFALIVKKWKHPFLHTALNMQHSAVDCRGPGGDSLLMIGETREKVETVLKFGPDVNATNDAGDTVLHHAIKKHLVTYLQDIIDISQGLIIADSVAECNFILQKMKDVAKECEAFIENVIHCMVDVNNVDANGKTALQIILECFQCGSVFTQTGFPIKVKLNNGYREDSEVCAVFNEILTHVVYELLRVHATLPGPDDFGRTPLMLVAQSPWSLQCIDLLIQIGIDVNANDESGNNAMWYLIKSFVQHFHLDCSEHFIRKSSDVDKMAAMLYDHGCNVQGTNVLMVKKYGLRKLKALAYLMALHGSELNQRQFPQKLELKNDPHYDSFFGVLFTLRSYDVFDWGNVCDFKMSDLALVEREILAGVKTNKVPKRFGSCMGRKLKVTEALDNILCCMNVTECK